MADWNALTETEQQRVVYTLLGEAAGEGDDGMAAVMHVILNRASDGRWPSNPADVAYQHNTAGVHQFSTWNSKALGGNNPELRYAPGSPTYNRAASVAAQVANGEWPDETGGALYYRRAGSAQPSWWDDELAKASGQVRIGNHTFIAQATRREVAPIPATLTPHNDVPLPRPRPTATPVAKVVSVSQEIVPLPRPAPDIRVELLKREVMRMSIPEDGTAGPPQPMSQQVHDVFIGTTKTPSEPDPAPWFGSWVPKAGVLAQINQVTDHLKGANSPWGLTISGALSNTPNPNAPSWLQEVAKSYTPRSLSKLPDAVLPGKATPAAPTTSTGLSTRTVTTVAIDPLTGKPGIKDPVSGVVVSPTQYAADEAARRLREKQSIIYNQPAGPAAPKASGKTIYSKPAGPEVTIATGKNTDLRTGKETTVSIVYPKAQPVAVSAKAQDVKPSLATPVTKYGKIEGVVVAAPNGSISTTKDQSRPPAGSRNVDFVPTFSTQMAAAIAAGKPAPSGIEVLRGKVAPTPPPARTALTPRAPAPVSQSTVIAARARQQQQENIRQQVNAASAQAGLQQSARMVTLASGTQALAGTHFVSGNIGFTVNSNGTTTDQYGHTFGGTPPTNWAGHDQSFLERNNIWDAELNPGGGN